MTPRALIRNPVPPSVPMLLALAAVLLLAADPAAGQFDSGSSGVHGAFPPIPAGFEEAPPPGTRYLLWNLTTGLVRYCSSYNTTDRPETCAAEVASAQLPGIPGGGLMTGTFEFTDVDIHAGDTGFLQVYLVGIERVQPLRVLSQNDIRLSVTLFADGTRGKAPPYPNIHLSGVGGRPGPGGFPGGAGGTGGDNPSDGNPGFGPAGGAGGVHSTLDVDLLVGASAGSSPLSVSLAPLSGGSSGGGGAGVEPDNPLGCGANALGYGGAGGGAGGGGVLLAASDEIVLDGTLTVRGGDGATNDNTVPCRRLAGGGGEGGNVRLVASAISGFGTINLAGGSPLVGPGGAGGRVRMEAFSNTYDGNLTGAAGGSLLQFPTDPVPADLPLLRILSVGGVAAPAEPGGQLDDPDVSFPAPPANPAAVELAAAFIPLGTTVDLRATPQVGAAETATSGPLAGTLESSTAGASLTIPPGFGQITAVASFEISAEVKGSLGLARLPKVDGEEPRRVEVTALAGGGSRVDLVADSGARLEIARPR